MSPHLTIRFPHTNEHFSDLVCSVAVRHRHIYTVALSMYIMVMHSRQYGDADGHALRISATIILTKAGRCISGAPLPDEENSRYFTELISYKNYFRIDGQVSHRHTTSCCHIGVTRQCASMCFNSFTWQWRHNERDCVSNHRHFDCLLNRLFRRRSKKTSKLRVTGLCGGNSPVIGEFPTQRKMFPFDVSTSPGNRLFSNA